MNIKIIIATHKKYQMPNDTYYLPLHVGKAQKKDLGYQGDDTGDNISYKNSYYCELTGLYWGWKNLKVDYIGLVHYRRLFTNRKFIYRLIHKKQDCILNNKEIEELLQKNNIILPIKRNYIVETLYSHYKHTLYVEPLDETKKIIEEIAPDYLEVFDKKMKSTKAHMFNMFIMKKSYCDEYCEWLFEILEELEKRIDPSQYDSFHARYLGRISEILLDVWIEKNNYNYIEIPVINMEKVHWLNKINSFLKAKFINKKYEKSF